MPGDIIAWFPRDLSFWHLHRTWLYWLLVIFLAAETIYFQPRSLRFLRQCATRVKPPTGPWGNTRTPSSKVIVAIGMTSILSVLTFFALLLASAVAFYTALLGLIPAALRFADEIPHAHTSESIGAAIGSFIGGALQIILIISAISSIDFTSKFPLRLPLHVDQKATS